MFHPTHPSNSNKTNISIIRTLKTVNEGHHINVKNVINFKHNVNKYSLLIQTDISIARKLKVVVEDFLHEFM